jgi:hypothetical protein
MERKDWLVTLYDKKGKEIDSYEVKDRTEQECSNETMHEVERRSKVDDWTMVPLDEPKVGTQKSPFGIGS